MISDLHLLWLALATKINFTSLTTSAINILLPTTVSFLKQNISFWELCSVVETIEFFYFGKKKQFSRALEEGILNSLEL